MDNMDEDIAPTRDTPTGDRHSAPADECTSFSPQIASSTREKSPELRLRAVARVFKIFGWFWVVVYTPMVAICVGSLVITLAGHRIDSPLVLAGASAFNGAILWLAILYVRTGRRISRHDATARRRALFMSCFMMLGVPVLTVVGAICYRDIKRYLNYDGSAVAA
jgi:hypothetical protein